VCPSTCSLFILYHALPIPVRIPFPYSCIQSVYRMPFNLFLVYSCISVIHANLFSIRCIFLSSACLSTCSFLSLSCLSIYSLFLKYSCQPVPYSGYTPASIIPFNMSLFFLYSCLCYNCQSIPYSSYIPVSLCLATPFSLFNALVYF
jgi:hypothetical protein